MSLENFSNPEKSGCEQPHYATPETQPIALLRRHFALFARFFRSFAHE